MADSRRVEREHPVVYDTFRVPTAHSRRVTVLPRLAYRGHLELEVGSAA